MKTGDLVRGVWDSIFIDNRFTGKGRYVDGRGPFIYVSDLNDHQSFILLLDGRLGVSRSSQLIGFK